jgi:hypothetical protein
MLSQDFKALACLFANISMSPKQFCSWKAWDICLKFPLIG